MKFLRARKPTATRGIPRWLVAFFVVDTIAFVFAAKLAPAALDFGAGLAGIRLHTQSINANFQRIRFEHLRIDRNGSSASVAGIVVDYKPFHISVIQPVVTIVHNADGTWQLPIALPAADTTAHPNAKTKNPWNTDLAFDIIDGQLIINAPNAALPAARQVAITGIQARCERAGIGSSVYRGALQYAGSPVQIAGNFAAASGRGQLRLQSARVELAPLVDALVDRPEFIIDAGTAQDLDITGFVMQNVAGDMQYHLSGGAQLQHGALQIIGINAPLKNLQGPLRLGDGGLLLDNVQGTLLQSTLAINGGLSNLADLRLALSARVHGDAHDLRHAFTASNTLALQGPLQIALTASGPVSDPLLLVHAESSQLNAAGFAVEEPRVDVALNAGKLTVLGAHAHNARSQIQFAGTLGLTAQTALTMVGGLQAPTVDVQAALALENRGGAFMALGQLQNLGMVANGALAPDKSAGTASVLGGRGDEQILGRVRIDHELLVGGGSFDRLAVPGYVNTLGGTFALAQGNGHEIDAAQVALHDIAPQFIAQIAPALPAGLAPTQIDLAGGGDQRALAISQVELTGQTYHLIGAGILGRDDSALRLQATANLAALGNSALHGQVAGPLAVFTHAKTVQVGTDGLEFTGASIAGVPLSELVGGVKLGPPTVAALMLRSNQSAVTLSGDPARQLRFSVANLALQDLPASPVRGTVDAMGWVAQSQGKLGAIVRNGTVQGIPVHALAVITRHASQADIQVALVQLGSALAQLQGHAAWLGPGHLPQYDIRAKIRDAELRGLITALVPAASVYEPEATATADLHIAGSGANAQGAGTIVVPSGNINGLPLRNGQANFTVDGRSANLQGGQLEVGSSGLRFAAQIAPRAQHAQLQARHLDLGELADAAAPGSALDGEGSLDIAASLLDGRLLSRGDVDIRDLGVGEEHVGTIDLGHATGAWQTQGDWIAGRLKTQGESASGTIAGQIQPRLTASHALSPRSEVNLVATVRNVDIGSRLALLGVHAPVSGQFDVDGTLMGQLQAPRAVVNARLHGSSILGFPVQTAELHAALSGSHVLLKNLAVVTSGFAVFVSGSVAKLAADSPLALTIHAASPHLAVLVAHILGRTVPVDGAGSTTMTVAGKINAPKVVGAVALEDAKVATVPITEAVARFSIDSRALAISDAEVELPSGSIDIAGNLPLTLSPLAIGPAAAPLSLNLNINDVDLASFAKSLPPQSVVKGLLSGAVALEGTPASPHLIGAVHLANGAFALRNATAGFDQVKATAIFAGSGVNIHGQSNVGGGTFKITGSADLPNLTDISSADSSTQLQLTVNADNAHFALAGLGDGTLNGTLNLVRIPNEAASLQGQVALSDATIPPSSFLAPKPAAAAPPPSGFIGETQLDVGLKVGPDVRLRSGAIDLGALGAVQLGGAVSAPTLSGTFAATGGTVTYLNRSFRVQRGRVAFDAADGISPTIDAAATTTVTNPDPSSARNASGQAVITLTLSGQPDHLNVGLSSNPEYSREQILGLLLDASLVRAVDFNSGGPNSGGGPATISGGSNGNAQSSFQNEALGLLDAQFSQSLLSPITSAIGGAVGLSDLGVSLGTTGTVGVTASRRLSGNLSLFFEDSLGLPTRQSLGVDLNPNDATAVSFSVYQEQGVTGIGRNGSTSAIFEPGRLSPVASGSASSGKSSNGVSISLQRRFK